MSFYPHTGRILEEYRKNTGRCHDSRQGTLGNSCYAHGKTTHGPFTARPPWRALGDPQNSTNWPGAWRCSKPEAHRKVLFMARRFGCLLVAVGDHLKAFFDNFPETSISWKLVSRISEKLILEVPGIKIQFKKAILAHKIVPTCLLNFDSFLGIRVELRGGGGRPPLGSPCAGRAC